jgi:NADH:ubiquinone oxidoreductase subunit 3 (subunit A)
MDMPNACNCVIGLECVTQCVHSCYLWQNTHARARAHTQTHILGFTIQNYILLMLYSCFDIKIHETFLPFVWKFTIAGIAMCWWYCHVPCFMPALVFAVVRDDLWSRLYLSIKWEWQLQGYARVKDTKNMFFIHSLIDLNWLCRPIFFYVCVVGELVMPKSVKKKTLVGAKFCIFTAKRSPI